MFTKVESRANSKEGENKKSIHLIPCHRVIRKTGAFGEYHWGTARKQALLAWEASHTDHALSGGDKTG